MRRCRRRRPHVREVWQRALYLSTLGMSNLQGATWGKSLYFGPTLRVCAFWWLLGQSTRHMGALASCRGQVQEGNQGGDGGSV